MLAGLDRHAAVGVARRERQGPLRADPRLGARHRRPGQGESAGDDPVARDDVPLHVRARRRRRPDRARGARGARRRACAPATSRCPASRSIGTRAMGDAVVAALRRPVAAPHAFVDACSAPRRLRLHRDARRRAHRKKSPRRRPDGRVATASSPRAAGMRDGSRSAGDTMRVGFVGWRGMVGSVLMQRMLEERDFDTIEPVFFSTSNAGGNGPRSAATPRRCATRTTSTALAGARRDRHLPGRRLHQRRCYPKLRAAGWNGYWIDAASRAAHEGRRGDHPRPGQPRRDRRGARSAACKNYIGGNCTVSLMMMALAGLFQRRPRRVDDVHDLPGGVGRRRAEHARAARADGRGAPGGAKALLDDPASAILDIDREVAGILRDPTLPDRALRRAARRQPDPVDRQGPRQRHEPRGVEGRRRDCNKILGRGRLRQAAIPVESICVRIGAMRCHSQALTIKLRARPAARRDRAHARRRQRVGARRSQHARRQRAAADAGGGHRNARDPGRPRCASSRWAASTSARSPSATSCCGAPPSRCGACCGSCSDAERRVRRRRSTAVARVARAGV